MEMDVAERRTSLHVFVEYQKEIALKIFSINKVGNGFNCVTSNLIPRSHIGQTSQRVVHKNQLYCLNHRDCDTENEEIVFRPTFAKYRSVSMRAGVALKAPPLHIFQVEMSSLGDGIYLYNSDIKGDRLIPESTKFSNEEIERGIFVYECGIDDWFPVPPMKKVVRSACMTACEDTLYLCGGEKKCAQAYDPRTRGWRFLPRTHYTYEDKGCVAYNGKVYICGGVDDRRAYKAEKYDPVAGKWEIITSMKGDYPLSRIRLVSFENLLWAVNFRSLTVERYDLAADTWRFCPLVFDAVEMDTRERAEMDTYEHVFCSDAVVFKS